MLIGLTYPLQGSWKNYLAMLEANSQSSSLLQDLPRPEEYYLSSITPGRKLGLQGIKLEMDLRMSG